MRNLDLDPPHALTTFRRLSLGTWRTARDPSVYGSLTLRMDEALAYLDAFRAETGRHLTVTHLMARAAAAVFERMPDANVLLRLGRPYHRRDVAVFFQVAMEESGTGKADLSGATIHDASHKTLAEIFDELEAKFAAVRADRDKELAGVRRLISKLPVPLIGKVLDLSSFLSYTLNLDLRWAGVPRDAFGSIMITNVGSLGLEEAYVPLVPYSRVPILLALGAIREVPVAHNGRVTTERAMKVCATFDHRILDGAQAAAMAQMLREWMEHPFEHFDELEGYAARDVQLH